MSDLTPINGFIGEIWSSSEIGRRGPDSTDSFLPFFFIRLGKQKDEERKGDLSDLLARAADKTAVAGTLTALSEGDEDDETEKKEGKGGNQMLGAFYMYQNSFSSTKSLRVLMIHKYIRVGTSPSTIVFPFLFLLSYV